MEEKKVKPTGFEAPPNEYSNIKKVIAVVSGKGGVGKSLVTSMLAVLSARSRYYRTINPEII